MLKNILSSLLIVTTLLTSTPAVSAIRLEYTPAQNQENKKSKEWLESKGQLQKVLDSINGEFVIPGNIRLSLGSSHEQNDQVLGNGLYYDRQLRTIYIPYSFVNTLKRFYDKNYYPEDDNARDFFVREALIHTLYHELGHALTDILDIPVLGKEEDAVDDFAALMMINLQKQGQKRTLSAADLYWFDGLESSSDMLNLMGAHSIDSQRAYRALCLTYGSNPDTYSGLAADVGFDDERMAFCEARYSKQRWNWLRLLEPGLNKKGQLFQLYTKIKSELALRNLDKVTDTGDKEERVRK